MPSCTPTPKNLAVPSHQAPEQDLQTLLLKEGGCLLALSYTNSVGCDQCSAYASYGRKAMILEHAHMQG